jgi:hypothetical protein
MSEVEQAIMRTILYASVFEFALTLDELHRYLIAERCHSQDILQEALDTSDNLQHLLIQAHGYIALCNHPDWIENRIKRQQVAQQLWASAFRYGRWLAHLPFVRMVALTGALSVENPADFDDDFDYVIIAKTNRVWVARIFAIMLVRLVRPMGRELCPNYIVAENTLHQKHHNVFVAHELAQMKPIIGGQYYHNFLESNVWVLQYLPNITPFYLPTSKPYKFLIGIRRIVEWTLSGQLGHWIEQWEYRRKSKRFQHQHEEALQRRQAESVISEQEVKGHFSEHGQRILNAYQQYLRHYGLG